MAQTSPVTIQVRSSQGVLPIRGARVIIKDQQGKVLFDQKTDANGRITTALPSLPRSTSQVPNHQDPPYLVYDVEISKEGFNSLHINDMEVFEGKVFQPVTLLPMLQNQQVPTMQERYVGEPAVDMDQQMNTLAEPAGSSSGLYSTADPDETLPSSLSLVIIRDPITVHLGAPQDTTANNVTLPFVDYIKNVACSEIYPTWPEEAIKANVYAIITFTLNRTFTNWYRSQGYDFDITSTTQYDQYFVYDRTIFEPISDIVEEIFNEYIRRPGQVAPFFTSYCNGTTSTCAGLSQWGTVDLANQGLTALEILRTYYPSDIQIAETNLISGTVELHPDEDLTLGMEDRNVEKMQGMLARIRKAYPSIEEITDPPGYFGPTTEAAVKTFQDLFDLYVDGVVGKATWLKMMYIYTAVTKLAGLESEGIDLGVGRVPPNTVIQEGSTGYDVILLQYVLNILSGFYDTIDAPTQDGIYGPDTAKIVQAFQNMEHINADTPGVVGEETWDTLYEELEHIRQEAPVMVGADTWNSLYDTLWGIADTNISADNTLNEPKDADAFPYTIQHGDSLWALSQRFRTSIDELKALNSLGSDALDVGTILIIPNN